MAYNSIFSKSMIAAAAAFLIVGCSSGNDNKANNDKANEPQEVKADDAGLGQEKQLTYKGLLPAASGPGIEYVLEVTGKEHSGDGTFKLQQIYKEAQDGKDETFTSAGKFLTQRGMPGNDNATVLQCVSDKDNETFNFLKENDSTLVLLSKDFEKPQSGLDYTLKLVK